MLELPLSEIEDMARQSNLRETGAGGCTSGESRTGIGTCNSENSRGLRAEQLLHEALEALPMSGTEYALGNLKRARYCPISALQHQSNIQHSILLCSVATLCLDKPFVCDGFFFMILSGFKD